MPKELPFFYNNNNYKLFGVLHDSALNMKGAPHKQIEPTSQSGIVFCAAFAEEKLWSHRVLVNYARRLACEGVPVLRFDFMGEGDSEGVFEDSTIDTRLSDIAKSIEELREKSKVKKIGLLGLRLGACLALLAASELDNIEFLILWEPITKIEAYLQKFLRLNLVSQMVAYKKIIKNRTEIISDLLNGEPANVEGYLLSSTFYKQATNIDLLDEYYCFPKPVQVVHIASNQNDSKKREIKLLYENKFEDVNQINEFISVSEEPFWTEIKFYYQHAPNLFHTTSAWLKTITAM